LKDLYNGKEVTLKITHNILCPACGGTGGLEGKPPKKCPECDGKGQRVQVTRMASMITRQIVTCPSCSGTGELLDPKDRCKKCLGKKVIEEKKPQVVHVEPGMEEGEKIVFQGAADEHPNADPGDLVVVLSQRKHDRFQRKHDDLLIVKKISLSQALFPQNFVIKHLDGRQLIIGPQSGVVITPGAVKIIEREGMPQRGNTYQKGRLFVVFEINFPRKSELTPDLRAAIAAALPPPNEAAAVDENDENVCKVTMRDSDMTQFESASSSRQQKNEAYGSQDQYEERGGRRSGGSTQCHPM
jgi:DnaJ family protein A protein 2